MPSIEENLNRIATALEKIAANTDVMASNSKFLSGLSSKAQREVEAPAPAAAPAPTKPAAPAVNPAPSLAQLPAPEDRDGIKAELDKRKVTYNPRLATKTLYEMLLAETQATPVSDGAKADAIAGAAAARPRPTPTATAPGAPVAMTEVLPEPALTPDVVREAMKKFAYTYGNDKMLALLGEFGFKDVSSMAAANKAVRPSVTSRFAPEMPSR